MVSAMAFMHLRSTVGMARKVRRTARRLREVLLSQPALKAEVKKGEEHGDVEAVTAALTEVLAAQGKEENILDFMAKEDLILLNEENKLVEGEEGEMQLIEKRVRGLRGDTHKKVSAVLDEVNKMILEIHQEVAGDAAKFKKEVRDMYRNRKRIIRYFSQWTDEHLVRAIWRLANKEYKSIKGAEKEETGFEKAINDMTEAIKKQDSAAIIAAADEVLKDVKKEKSFMIEEGKELLEMMHDINIIHIRLLEKITGADPQEFRHLIGEGFPHDIINKLENEDHKQLLIHAHHSLRHLYKIARWEKRHV